MNTIKNQKTLRLLAVLLILACLAGIWAFKNHSDAADSSSIQTGDPNFALVATSLDLAELQSYGLPMILDFGSEGCAPCREMYPVLETVNAEMQGKVIIKFSDIWENPELAEGYPLTVIPTQFFFDREGKPFTPADPESLGMTLVYSDETGEHLYTMHEGGLTEEDFAIIFAEMGIE